MAHNQPLDLVAPATAPGHRTHGPGRRGMVAAEMDKGCVKGIDKLVNGGGEDLLRVQSQGPRRFVRLSDHARSLA